MLPVMAAEPRIAIIGAGNLGSALAYALRRAGYAIEVVLAHSRGASLRKAKKLAENIGSRAVTEPSALQNADVIWFCVPDSAIAQAAKALAQKLKWKGKVALHSSGALTSDELAALRRRGAAVASAHPFMTFVRGSFSGRSSSDGSSSVRSRPSLAGVPFALEGDARALRVAQHIVQDLGGDAYPIRKKDKAVYHAWGTFASPLLTALLAASERVAALAGLDRKAARRRMIPILLQTLANYATFDAAGAFSGPIVRGDVDTVKRHLRVLRKDPVIRDVYVALANAALRYLPAKNLAQLHKALR
jgi:predicted short-subunit dehydrogenase-like oxidoreductase (DUF2520 family)